MMSPNLINQSEGGSRRRDFLTPFVGVAFLAGIGKVADEGRKDYIENHSRKIRQMAEFFRGKDNQSTIEIFGRAVNYEELRKILSASVKPPLSSPEQAGELMASFADMMEVEEKFDKPYNTLPILESTDQAAEKVLGGEVSLASSFGYSQINPFTALRLGVENEDTLEKNFIGVKDKLSVFKGRLSKNIKPPEIVEALDLRGNGNVIFGFQAFYEVYNIYGRDRQGKLHSRLHDPRAFSLAVAGYSGTPLTPMSAKVQVMARETALANSLLGENDAASLVVDGSLGEKAEKAIRENFSPGVFGKYEEFKNTKTLPGKLRTLEDCAAQIYVEWNIKFRELMEKQKTDPDPNVLAALVEGRYSAINGLKVLLQRYASEYSGQAKREKTNLINQLYESYVKSRKAPQGKPGFIQLVKDSRAFEALFPEFGHKEFLKAAAQIAEQMARFDSRYKGVIPTNFISYPWADDVNIMDRVVLGHRVKDQYAREDAVPKMPRTKKAVKRKK